VLIRTLSTSRQWRLAVRPAGKIRKSDFELVEVPIPEPDDGQFVVAVTHISLDPVMRGWMNANRSYIPPVEIGEVMRALRLGRVIDSRNDQFGVGELVHGAFGVSEYALSDGVGVHKISPAEGFSPVDIDAFPTMLERLFTGENTGKLVLELQ
jgi:NADPH-dependent curcumin reductase CurA